MALKLNFNIYNIFGTQPHLCVLVFCGFALWWQSLVAATKTDSVFCKIQEFTAKVCQLRV